MRMDHGLQVDEHPRMFRPVLGGHVLAELSASDLFGKRARDDFGNDGVFVPEMHYRHEMKGAQQIGDPARRANEFGLLDVVYGVEQTPVLGVQRLVADRERLLKLEEHGVTGGYSFAR